MAKIIGIDLGTSNSQASVLEASKPIIIPSAEGSTYAGKMFPSYVAFTKNGELLVGEPAKRQAITNPEGTVMAAKRKMGTDFKYKIYGKEYTPQQISAFILQKIKKDAEAFLGEKVDKAVITVPAYFNDNQRQATKDAGAIAGLEVVRIINEPTAAALAYGLDKAGKNYKIAVLDLGGGTFDVTIMDMYAEGGKSGFEVISTSGDTQLGGTDMDNRLVDFLVNEFKKDTGIDIRNDKTAMQRLRDAGEKAKIELSSVYQTSINLPFITADANGPKHLDLTLTRAKLEEIISPVIERLDKPMRQALEDTKLTPNQIDKIILVGGPTRMPIVQKKFREFFGKEPERGVDPMECVAMGAAIQGGVIGGEVKDLLLLDVTPLSLGVETLGGVFTKLIERNTTIPTRKSQIFSTASDFQTSVEIHVLQGERPMASDNTTLGRFHLIGIPPAPRGIPQIEVSFDIDANGIMHVSAKDLATGNQQKITITASTKLSKEQIDKMIKDAEKFAKEDEKKRERIELKNQADSLIYTIEKTLKDAEGKISAENKAKAENSIKELREAIKSDDAEQIKRKIDELNKVMGDIATQMYQQAGQQYQQQQAQQTQEEKKEKGKEKVVDADYKVVDEEK